MSAVLLLAGMILVLPNAALALFFAGVGLVAEQQTLGAIAKAAWTLLLRLPDPGQLALILIALLVGVVLFVVAAIRYPALLPAVIAAVGVASLVYVAVFAGMAQLFSNPLAWSSLVGVALALWQLWRVLTAGVPAPA